MFDWVKKLLGSSNDAEVKKLQKTVNAVEALEDEYKALTDEQLRAKTDEFRARLQNGETEDDILPKRSPPSAKPTPACWECARTVCR